MSHEQRLINLGIPTDLPLQEELRMLQLRQAELEQQASQQEPQQRAE